MILLATIYKKYIRIKSNITIVVSPLQAFWDKLILLSLQISANIKKYVVTLDWNIHDLYSQDIKEKAKTVRVIEPTVISILLDYEQINLRGRLLTTLFSGRSDLQ